MEHKPISSSAIVSAGYDPESKLLQVTMTGGKTYDYPGVSKEDAHLFLNSPTEGSHGKHLARFIRPKYGREAQKVTA